MFIKYEEDVNKTGFQCSERSLIGSLDNEKISKVLYETIIKYLDYDNQIGLYKGLPHICLGLLYSIPLGMVDSIEAIDSIQDASFMVFSYFMENLKIREIFKNAMPLYC